MTLCVLKRILRKKKSIFMQPLESPITPLTVAALRMIICKRPVPPDDHLQEASPSVSSFARGQPLRMTICKRPVPPDHYLQVAGPSSGACDKYEVWHYTTLFAIDIDDIRCLEPFIPLYDHFEILRFLGPSWQ